MVATAERELVFYSQHAGLRLIRQRAIEVFTAAGMKQVVQPEVVADFSEETRGGTGRLLVREGEGRMVDEDGVERDLVSWLRQHPQRDLLFFESGAEPGALRPSEEEFNDAVVDATASMDEEALRQLVDAERDSHGRQHLIDRAERALERLGALTHSVVSGSPD